MQKVKNKWIVLFCAVLLVAGAGVTIVSAADEECDVALSYDEVADRLCLPGIALEDDIVIDGDRSDWAADSYYNFSEHSGLTHQVQAFVSHKKTGFNQNDLYIFFEIGANDATGTFDDEIRIGLNSGTDPDDNVLVVIHPFGGGGVTTDVYDYDPGTNTWNPAGAGWLAAADVAVLEDPVSEYWSVEIRLPLHSAPNPITGNDFRLYMETHVDDTQAVIVYPWPPHYVFGAHNYICVNPQRWHPMSFGEDCFADLHIANGLYSCDAVYILRDGAKSREIVVDEMNEFHADVTNGDANLNAEDVQVYMTLLQLGTSTAPLAMNYSHTDVNVRNWFEEQWGSWLLATDELDTGSPKPPDTFTVNASSTNTDARFNWRPSDETRFGDPADMIGSHKCTAAFVDYKNDPNMANNFSYCNTQIVDCPEGQVCMMNFWMGNYYAYNHAQGAAAARQLLRASALNTPYAGWFKNAKLQLKGEGIERIKPNVYQIYVPRKGNNKVEFGIAAPPRRRQDLKSWQKRIGQLLGIPADAHAAGLKPNEIVARRNKRLVEMYGDYPIVIMESLVEAGYKHSERQDRVQLYRPTNYVAFVIKPKAEVKPPGGGICGRSRKKTMAVAPFVVFFGLFGIYRRIGRKRG